MKKIILPLAFALVFFTCSCNSNSTKSGMLDEEVYENPHMPDDEAQKYGHMMNLLEDLDAMTKSYTANKSEGRFKLLTKTYSELNYEYDDSEMDAEGRRQSMLLQARVDSARNALGEVIKTDLATMKFPLVCEEDHLIETTQTWPIYLQKGNKLHYTLSTGGNVTMRILNADAHNVLKTYAGKKTLVDSIAIQNSAIYLVEVSPRGSAYIDLNVSQQYANVDQMNEPKHSIRVDTVECGAKDFMAVKVQGIEMRSIFEEPKKVTLRSVGKAFFGGSSRAVVTLDVPRGCTDLMYSLRISTNEGDKSSDGKFDKRMTESYKKIRFLGIPLYEREKSHSNLFRELLYSDKPVRDEDAYCNVYVFTNQGEAKKFQDGEDPSKLKYNIDLSLMGTQSCNGRIPTKGLSKIYFGFANERFRYSNYLWLEVIAASPKNEYYRISYKLD